MTPPITNQDLLPSEVAFDADMWELGFGIFKHLQIRGGEMVVEPAPVTVRHVKFGTPATPAKRSGAVSELRQQTAELFAYIRGVDRGEIRTLEIRHGIPFSMEVELAGAQTNAAEGGRRG